MKKLKVPKNFKPGDLLKARNKMSAAYLAKEAKEKPYSKMSKAELKHEAKESPAHEAAEHMSKKQVLALKKGGSKAKVVAKKSAKSAGKEKKAVKVAMAKKK